MKTLLFILILTTIWTQAKADDPHYPAYVDPVVNTVDTGVDTNTAGDVTIETTQILNLSSSAIAAAIASGQHHFTQGTDKFQLSGAIGTHSGEYAGSIGFAITLNRSVLLSGAANFEEGGSFSGGGAVGVQF